MKLFNNSKDKDMNLALVPEPKGHSQFPKDLDLVEIPIEGVAAYWLSLLRVLKSRKSPKLIQDEADYTSEPYIKHLLEIGFTGFGDDQIRRYASIKEETLLRELARKLVLISIGVLGIATNENPQQVLVRIISKFPVSPILEQKVFAAAQEILSRHATGKNDVDIDHRMDIENLIVHLIFFCMLARRQGRAACQPYLKKIRSQYFTEGLSLIIDGFEYDFIKHRLNLQKGEILNDTRRKMSMSLEMCLAIRGNMAYEDVFKIAKSFLL